MAGVLSIPAPIRSNIVPLSNLLGGQAMKKLDDAERQIIRDWKALPKIERQTINQAWCFADEIERRYPFRGEARPYRVILGSIADYQSRIGKPLKVR